MKINRSRLPIKAHYFFFMASMGPILPFTVVFGKQLGISEIVMGSITAFFPFLFLIAKPVFGFIADYFQTHRKLVFICLIFIMCSAHLLLFFVPASPLTEFILNNTTCNIIEYCGKIRETHGYIGCNSSASIYHCSWKCNGNSNQNGEDIIYSSKNCSPCLASSTSNLKYVCSNFLNLQCYFQCENKDSIFNNIYSTWTFWSFIILMAVGSTAYNIANSISDAICFDVLGSREAMSYGNQRVFGAIGFGLSALVAGYAIDLWSAETTVKNYTPAFALTLIFGVLDIITCAKLKLPKLPKSKNILKDVGKLLKQNNVVIFLTFAALAGICDSFIIYFMFWYLEDLAFLTGALEQIKFIEGLIIAAETLGGEVIFFSYAGKIIDKLGYANCLSLSFAFYALRLGLISLAPSPWWILPTEFFLQGPSYALCYTTIVAYANAVAPPGTSATMQGLVAGVDDGFGYAIGSFAGGFLYRWLGGSKSFIAFCGLATFCTFSHILIRSLCFSRDIPKDLCSAKYTGVSQEATQAHFSSDPSPSSQTTEKVVL